MDTCIRLRLTGGARDSHVVCGRPAGNISQEVAPRKAARPFFETQRRGGRQRGSRRNFFFVPLRASTLRLCASAFEERIQRLFAVHKLTRIGSLRRFTADSTRVPCSIRNPPLATVSILTASASATPRLSIQAPEVSGAASHFTFRRPRGVPPRTIDKTRERRFRLKIDPTFPRPKICRDAWRLTPVKPSRETRSA